MSEATASETQPALSDAQWQGLAKLADMVNAAPQFAGPLTGQLTELLALSSRYDLTALATSLLDTAQALHSSGLLKQLTENANLIAETIELLVPLAGTLQEKLAAVPFEELKQDLQRVRNLLDKADYLAEFTSKHLAGPLVGWSVQAASFAEREQLSESVTDVLETLGHLHRNGTLSQLREVSDYLQLREQRQLLSDLAGEGIDSLGSLPARAGQLLGGVQAALDDAKEDAGHLGGIKGLLHLLRDPEVQQGMRALAVLPSYLDGKDRH